MTCLTRGNAFFHHMVWSHAGKRMLAGLRMRRTFFASLHLIDRSISSFGMEDGSSHWNT